MGRGSSKAGGGSGGVAVASGKDTTSATSIIKPTEAEQAIYDTDRTMAFPSSASVVKRVPALKSLDTAMKNAPEGTVVAFKDARINQKVVYEKIGSTSWRKSTIQDDGNVRVNGTFKGIKALQSVSDVKYYTSYWDGIGLTAKEAELIKKKKTTK